MRVISVRRLLFLLSSLLFLLAACKSEPAEPTPTPPPVEKVECAGLMDWIRLRPLSKRCEQDEECVLQTDDCCDITAVHRRYARTCERTCGQACPQDSIVGHQLEWRAVCRQGACELAQSLGGQGSTPAP